MRSSVGFTLLLTFSFLSCTVAARDWFVSAASGGDGSREKPFSDPYLALEEAEPGDTIHVAQGVYHGKLNAANWVIRTPNLTWLGGYNTSFARRDPWRYPSELRLSKEFRGRTTGTLLAGDADNFVLDGFVLDQKEFNEYDEGPDPSLTRPRGDPLINFSSAGVQIRNCLVLNGGKGSVELTGAGARVENNIIMNMYGSPLVDLRIHQPQPAIIKGNTFLFCWKGEGGGGGGSPAGRGISFWSSDNEVQIIDNIFLGCDNWAVDANKAEQLVLMGNVFWLNASSNVKVYAKELAVQVENSSMADLEDAGLKRCEGNVAQNPELTGLDPHWMELFLDYAQRDYPATQRPALEAMRQSLGLRPSGGQESRRSSRHAMAYDSRQALRIVPAKLKQGAHPLPMPAPVFAASRPAANRTYEKTTWQNLFGNPMLLADKAVEVTGALGEERSYFPFEGLTEEAYRGFLFRDVVERLGEPPVVFFKKGSKAERALKELTAWNGDGKPTEAHLVRGLVKYNPAGEPGRQATILVDSVSAVVVTAPALQPRARPAGRDWFVRAGSPGKGSREAPFKDPWQALEAAQPGDTIHVAEGEYFGKLNSGTWKIAVSDVSLLGGYDTAFKERDPWKHPSRLGYRQGTSRGGSNAYIIGEEEHDGFVLDGFVLDGRDVNRIDQDGNLTSRFPERELVRLGGADLVIRNCVFVNAGGAALELSGENIRIENNIILNCNYYSLDVTGGTEHPFVIRNNTILFTWNWDKARGDRSSAGTAIFPHGDTRFDLDGNIIGYADGQAVLTRTKLKNLQIKNNVFTHNYYANVTDLEQVVVDDRNVALLSDLGLSAGTGNLASDPKLTFDAKWWAEFSRENGPTFFARPYDWKEALKVIPQDPACHAGARPVKIESAFAR